VLIGDAAGHNDPIAGCGLSIAMRDARSVGELITAGKRRAPDFAPYGVERMERMKRLRLVADVLNVASVETSTNRASRRCLFADAMAAMDPGIFPIVVGMFAGPESIPAHLVDDTVLDRIRAA
jgi:2-polyprenyl-6-methoxyphenol hydroxylase-like FAD-dependent oxidoreductase